MLHLFRFSNHGCFRDEAVLTLRAEGLGDLKNVLRKEGAKSFLPVIAVYGSNGGGKTTVLDALACSANFIRTSQRTQHENTAVPVRPFLLSDSSGPEPSSFEFIYTINGVKYHYGFSADRDRILTEYLYHSPKGREAVVFLRERQEFRFTKEIAKRKLISQTVAENQLYFSVACTMRDTVCAAAMQWFRSMLFFSRGNPEMGAVLARYAGERDMLDAIAKYAESADVGINQVQFQVKSTEPDQTPGGSGNPSESLPDYLPHSIRSMLKDFLQSIEDADVKIQSNEITAVSLHQGLDREKQPKMYPLSVDLESDGTKKLMALAPLMERTLQSGGVLAADELESSMHPALMEIIVDRFQNPETNPNNAQLIFTTHNTELLNAGLLRKDQIYLVDKSRESGAASLYSVSDFSTPTHENIRRAYLAGKFGAVPEFELRGVK